MTSSETSGTVLPLMDAAWKDTQPRALGGAGKSGNRDASVVLGDKMPESFAQESRPSYYQQPVSSPAIHQHFGAKEN